MRESFVAVVFLATIGGLYWRPSRVKDWQLALAGALIAWAISPLSLHRGLIVVRDSWNIEAFFLGLMLLAGCAESTGLYARAASLLVRAQPGQGQLAGVIASGATITAVLSNDATPLILTPAVFAAGASDAATNLMAVSTTLVSDGASLLLPTSNPVGLLFYERFDLSLLFWVSHILPAALVGIGVIGAILLWRGRDLASAPAPSSSNSMPVPWSSMQLAVVALFAALAVAYIVAAIAGVKLGLVTLGGGTVLLVAVLSTQGDTRPYRRALSPGLLIFVAALLLLVQSTASSGALDGLSGLFDRLSKQPQLVRIAGAAIAGVLLSNVMNNWAAAVVLVALIPAEAAGHLALVTGALIGCTIGADLTIIGSLSTLFWLSLAGQAGQRYTALEYVRAALLPTVAAVAAACLAAYLATL